MMTAKLARLSTVITALSLPANLSERFLCSAEIVLGSKRQITQ